jgi:hypothetical protein
MKKLIPLCIVGILILSGLGAAAFTVHRTKDVNIKTESIGFSDPILQDDGQYISVNLKEAASSLIDPGNPILPVVTTVFTFPFGTKISSVDVSFSATNKLTVSKEIIPASEPSPVDGTVVNDPIKNPAVYESAIMYPATSYRYTIGAGLNGTTHVIFLSVQCYPVRYSPAKNILYYCENAEIQVTYEEPATPTVFLDQYNLVIIAPSGFSNALQPLIDHKINMGMNTTLKTTEAIYSEYNGFDNAEKIKYFIKDAIETWGIDYVLLVGGINKVPIRTTWFYEKHH